MRIVVRIPARGGDRSKQHLEAGKNRILPGCRVTRKQPGGLLPRVEERRLSSCLLYKLYLKGGNAMKKIVGKIVRSRGLYYLLMIAALGLALGAGVKWHP